MKTLFGFLALLGLLALGACGDSKKSGGSPPTEAFMSFVQRLAATSPEDSGPDNTEPAAMQPETDAPLNL